MFVLLATGFRKELVFYNYSPGNTTRLTKASITDVGEGVYVSQHSGDRSVWQVTVSLIIPNQEPRKYTYDVDKETHRIWKVEIESGGVPVMLATNNEDDYNPYTHEVDKSGTLKLVAGGRSAISGQAFAKENSGGGGMRLININKKQYAPPGTVVILIPYTPFFKEWAEKNRASIRAGILPPLPKDALDCIRATRVVDKEGHFDFTGLLPGDFLLLSTFGYNQGVSETHVTGYTDTYIDGAFAYSNANTKTTYGSMRFTAVTKKMVTVKQDGETVMITLKQI